MRNRYDSSPTELVSRRDALRWGAYGSVGLTLGGLLRAESAMAAPVPLLPGPAPIRACIIVFYYGGPSHLETYDLKPDAPAEVRGEFKPISTSVPGLFVGEHLPKMSRLMHKVALVRGMHHGNRLHDSASTEALTGRQSPQGDREEFAPMKQFFPCYGATLTHQHAFRDPEVAHAALPFVFHNVVDTPCQGGGFLGSAFDPLQINVDPDKQTYQAGALGATDASALSRLDERRRLLGQMETGSVGSSATTNAGAPLRKFHERAYKLLGSEKLHRALDLTQEPAAIRDRYGFDPVTPQGATNGAEMAYARHMRGQNLLLARRLVEAGVPFVNVYDCRQQGQNWDSHADVFGQSKKYLLPLADRALAALISDLDERGLLESTLVVAMGEFGRTPKINAGAGRDHWPDCYTVLLAGGGVRGGYVYGASDRLGAYPSLDGVTPADLAATIYWRFGLNPAAEIHDQTGRPWRIADGQPITSVFS